MSDAADPWERMKAAARLKAAERGEAAGGGSSPPSPSPQPAVPAIPAAGGAAAAGPAAGGDPDIYPLRLGERLRGDWYPVKFRSMRTSRARRVLDRDVYAWWRDAFDAAADEDPAGTLPCDDAELCFLFGCGVDAWRDARARGALMGWREVMVVSVDGAELDVRLAHPEFTRAMVDCVEMIRKRSAASAAGAVRKRDSLLREALVKVGAPPAFLARADLVEAVQRRLSERGEARRPGHVRAAFMWVVEREARAAEEGGGDWKAVASIRNPLSPKNY